MILRKIHGLHGYFAGSDGHIYSRWTRGPKSHVDPSRLPHRLVAHPQSNGKYLIVCIKVSDRVYKTFRVHQLVCLAFHGSPKPGQECSHEKGNRFDNRPSKLLWETRKKNHSRKKIHGTDDRGIRNSRAKIDAPTLIKIRRLLAMGVMTHEQIGRRFGLDRVFITKVNCGHRYKGQLLKA